MLLTTTAEKIQLVLAGAVTTNELQWTTSFVDITSSAFTPGSNDGVSNGTTDVDIVAAPASSTQRQAKVISVYNADTASATVTIKFDDTGTERIYFKTTLSPGETLYWSQETGWSIIPEASILRGDHAVVSGRLTLTSGTPVTTSDVTAAGTVYFTPYAGNRIGLYDGTNWSILSFSEVSLSLSGLTANSNYDIFCYNNSGAVVLELLIWASSGAGSSARGTALTRQDGVVVESGDATRRYLGTLRITGTTGQCEDSVANRFLWNMYNRVHRPMRAMETTASWTYSSTTWRQFNNSAVNQLNFVVGIAEDAVDCTAIAYSESDPQGSPTIGIALNTTSDVSDDCSLGSGSFAVGTLAYENAKLISMPVVGYNYLAFMEHGAGSGTQTFYGYTADYRQSGIHALLRT